jgi:hypothetical protein
MTSTTRLTIQLDLPRELFVQEKALENPDYRLEEPTDLPVDPAAHEASFFDPVTVIAAVSLAVLAERLLHFVLTKYGKGVLVDTSKKPPHCSVVAGVPQGFVLLIHPDGRPEHLPADVARSTLGDILAKVLKP